MLDRLPGAIGLFDILLASWEPRRIYDATTNGNVCEARHGGWWERAISVSSYYTTENCFSLSLSFTALSFRRLLGFLLLADLPSLRVRIRRRPRENGLFERKVRKKIRLEFFYREFFVDERIATIATTLINA